MVETEMMGDLKTAIRGVYDVSKVRNQMGNRIQANFKAKLGQKPGESEETIDEGGKKVLENLRAHYKRITDGIARFPTRSQFKGDALISDYTMLCLVALYTDLLAIEKQHFRRVEAILKGYPVYTEFLKDIRGVGPAMAGVIVSEIDIHKARHPSSLWRYTGLDVTEDGAGRSRKKEHLIETTYTDKNGKEAIKKGISFNPFLKTKLLGVLGPSFLKAKDNKYAKAYYDYRSRLEHHKKYAEASKGHRHNMAIRYMVKLFLIDLHMAWREIEGLPVSLPYHEAKLGMAHKK